MINLALFLVQLPHMPAFIVDSHWIALITVIKAKSHLWTDCFRACRVIGNFSGGRRKAAYCFDFVTTIQLSFERSGSSYGVSCFLLQLHLF